MAHATDTSVLGDFSDVSFDYHGVRSRFFRENGRFLVETDGADGKLAVFEINYTFGIDPLQQYLIEFPDGRLQALSLAWDSRPWKGGQRWFHLYPDEHIRHDDFLHWTKRNQNWNFKCAECHSTGVRKNYDGASDRFATSWAEISVGCEACHGRARRMSPGQGTGKVCGRSEGATIRRRAWSLASTNGTTSPGRSTRRPATRGAASCPPAAQEVETCGLCHARRAGFFRGLASGRWLSTPTSSRRSSAGSITRMARCATRSYVWLVQAEQDVRGRRHLQRLPRAAQRQAEAVR